MKRRGVGALVFAGAAGAMIVAASSCGSSSDSNGAPGTSAPDGANTSDVIGTLSVERFIVDGTPAGYVRVVAPITSARGDLRYGNVAIDANGDHVIQPEEWLEKNVGLVVQPSRYGFYLPLADTAIAAATVTFVLSGAPLAAPWDGSIPAGAAGVSGPVTFASRAMEAPIPPTDPLVGGGGVMREDVPNTSQGKKNTCVPHAIASNVGWLARRYGFACKFDYAGWDKDGGIPDAGPQSVNAGNSAMAEDVLGTFVSSKLFDNATGGVNPADILKGKNKFVADKGLPIVTTRIPADEADTSGNGVFDGIVQAMDDGCAVELVVKVIFTDGKPFSHMVAVVGYSNSDQGKSISVNDSMGAPTDEDQGVVADTYQVMPGNRTDYWPVNNSRDPNPHAKIQFAIKECPKQGAEPVCPPRTVGLVDGGPDSSTTGARPVFGSFNAVFNQACFCTTYTVSATDPNNGPLHYVWSTTNPCGNFVSSDSATAVWTHPDSTNPGACPIEAIHPATIAVTVVGNGGAIKCTYEGGSGNGSVAQCIPFDPQQ